MSRRIHIRSVAGCFDMASQPQLATVTIDRDQEVFTVRPYRRRREYSLPLAKVAQMVVRGLLLAEARQKAADKRARTAARRRK